METLAFLTPDLPGTGGAIRLKIEDFVVEELPLYEPAGAGDHLYLTIQKAGISTHEAARRIARAFGVPAGLVGTAGLKDARAVTRQLISVQGATSTQASRVSIPDVTILDSALHGNKLRMGHLRGNRFHIRIRDVADDAESTADAVLQRLTMGGAANLFGAQRFGSTGEGHLVGRALVRRDPEDAVLRLLAGSDTEERDPRLREARRRYRDGDLEGARAAFPHAYHTEREVLDAVVRGAPPEKAIRRMPKNVYRLVVSAYQSWLFNRLLSDRVPEIGTLRDGDFAHLHDRGACFLVTDAAAEQPRADALEISPTAPLFGKKVRLAEGEPGREEQALLESEDLRLDDFQLPGLRLFGERRPLRVPVGGARVRADGEAAILVSFELPRGSFAACVLREVMKTDE